MHVAINSKLVSFNNILKKTDRILSHFFIKHTKNYPFLKPKLNEWFIPNYGIFNYDIYHKTEMILFGIPLHQFLISNLDVYRYLDI